MQPLTNDNNNLQDDTTIDKTNGYFVDEFDSVDPIVFTNDKKTIEPVALLVDAVTVTSANTTSNINLNQTSEKFDLDFSQTNLKEAENAVSSVKTKAHDNDAIVVLSDDLDETSDNNTAQLYDYSANVELEQHDDDTLSQSQDYDYSAIDNDSDNDALESDDTEPLVVAIIGLGLIGASLGRALVKRTNHDVLGRDLEEKTERVARCVKAIHAPVCDEGLALADVVIFATNPRITVELLPKYVGKLKDNCIVLDMGGLKRDVVRAMQALSNRYPNLNFIGGHPMAGREFSGLKYSIANLFDGASMLLTDVNSSDLAKQTVTDLFTQIGFKETNFVDSMQHDKIIAYTSQSCHAISAAFCLHSLADKHTGFSAGSFRDLTRVAKLNSQMWTELFCDNADNLSSVLSEFIGTLGELKSLIESGNEVGVQEFLARSNDKKQEL